MDFGDFIKIGISSNAEKRKLQLPYKVTQYYATDFLNNAFSVETRMHHMFAAERAREKDGREYFKVPFWQAVNTLKNMVIKDETHELDMRLKRLIVGGDSQEETEMRIIEKLKDAIPNMSEFDKGYILGKTESMAEEAGHKETVKKE